VVKKRKKEVVGTKKKDAEDRLTDRLKSLKDGTYRELQEITFADFADKWLKEYVLGAVKRTTYQAYECHVRVHFKPAFGALALRAIREDTIQGYIPRSWRVGQSPSPSRITSSFCKRCSSTP